MIKLPTIREFKINSHQAMKRFPFVFLAAFISFGLSFLSTLDRKSPFTSDLIQYILPSSLGLSLFLGLALFNQSKNISTKGSLFLYLSGILFLGFFGASYSGLDNTIYLYRFWQISLLTHLFVSFAPFFNQGSLTGFWEFNKSLYLRICTAVFYSGVLFIGLASAFWAVDSLLGMKIDGESYVRLWIFLAYIYNTWYFLLGIPNEPHSTNESSPYPVGLKVFAQFILLPLAIVYVIILYIYMGQIIIRWDWPRGTIGWLVSGYSVFGILSQLLLFPLQDKPEHKAVHWYSRCFYYLLFPLVILLFLAISRRVGEYGLTEKRYFLTLITGWLGFLSIYFGFLKKRNIKIIPVSLAFLTLISLGGPWGAYSMSRRNQVGRLESILKEVQMLSQGKIKKPQESVPFDKRREISGVFDYLVRTHGVESVVHLFSEKPTSTNAAGIMNEIGLTYVYPKSRIGSDIVSYSSQDHSKAALNIKGYDYLHSFNIYSYSNSHKLWKKIGEKEFSVRLSSNPIHFYFELRNGPKALIPIDPIIKKIESHIENNNDASPQRNLPAELLSSTFENEHFRIKIFFNHMHGKQLEDEFQVQSANGQLLIHFKRNG